MRTLPDPKQDRDPRRGRVPEAARVFKPTASSRIERFLGRVLAFVIFTLALPWMTLLAFLIWSYDRHTPLFWQARIGKGGTLFQMVKMRSMRIDADPYMTKPSGADPVITPIGRLIRHRAMDEWAQLWNVVKGEMALVGPRPEMGFIVDQYDEVEKLRLTVRPGLTGLWQLSRVRDRAIHHHIEYDLFYVYNRSFGMDIWLLWRTFLFAVFGIGTKIRLAAKRWERDTTWRTLVPERSKAIPRRTAPHLGKIWTFAGASLLLVALAPGILLAASARGNLADAKTEMLAARDEFKELRADQGSESLAAAEAELRDADEKLSSPLAIPTRLVPGMRQNLIAAQAITSAGLHMVEAGKAGLRAMDILPFGEGGIKTIIKAGSVDLSPLIAADSFVQEIRAEVRSARNRVEDSSTILLIPSVRSARAEMLEILDESKSQVDVAAGASFLIPRILGGHSQRTWVIAAENIAEPRGRGGYLGSLAFLKTSHGELSLGEFFPTSQLPALVGDTAGLPAEYTSHYQRIGALHAWQNLAMSPHFPSAGKVMLRRLEEASIAKADGIITVDPVALSYLLKAAGPVQVEGRPEPLNEENFVAWALNGQYFEFQLKNANSKLGSLPPNARSEELAEVADAIWKKVLSGEGIDPKALADAIGRALSERRMVLYSSDPREQELIERLGIGGAISQEAGDYLMVIGQNLGENKMDYYLQRSMVYQGKMSGSGRMDANLKLDIHNTAPDDIEFPGHVGSPRPGINLGAGEARSYLEVFVPASSQVSRVLIDGKASKEFEVREELGKTVLITTVTLGPGERQSIEYSYSVPDVLQDGEYRLTLQNQSTPNPDRLSVDISVPEHVEIGKREGFFRGPRLVWEGELVSDTELTAEVSAPWHVRLASKVSGWLNKAAIKIGE